MMMCIQNNINAISFFCLFVNGNIKNKINNCIQKQKVQQYIRNNHITVSKLI